MLHDPERGNAGAAGFYRSRRGRAAAQAIGVRLETLWPALGGMAVLGLGYPGPFLSRWRDEAYRCIEAISVHHGPPGENAAAQANQARPGGACSVDALRLPFPDLSFDRILVIHGVERAGYDERLLRELWRVLKDDGRMLVVAPNRTGVWAHLDSTPFGQGQPYSQGQIDRLLARSMFRAERRDCALFMPPMSVLCGPFWEKLGRVLLPRLAGVTLTEAVKDVYAAVPAGRAVARRRVVVAETA